MNRTTAAQRHNARMNKIFDDYKQQRNEKRDLLPTCTDYEYFLGKATEKLKIPIDEARSRYGRFTYGQWYELLGI